METMNTVIRMMQLLAVLALCITPMVHVCRNMEKAHGLKITLGTQNFLPQKETCTREGMDQCKYACMMPGGLFDLNCYEDCIYCIRG
jgi:hypothetical protein